MAETLFPDRDTGRGPDLQLINDDGNVYLRRWNLRFRLERLLQRLGLRKTCRAVFQTAHSVLLHNIVNPDPDRDMHNHPWPAFAIVLRGGYMQVVGDEAEQRVERVCWFNVLAEDEYHRILSVEPNTWTLTFTGPKLARGWGFLVWKPALQGRSRMFSVLYDRETVPAHYEHVDWRTYLGEEVAAALVPAEYLEVDA